MLKLLTNWIYYYRLEDTDYNKSGFLGLNKVPILTDYKYNEAELTITNRGSYFLKFGHYINKKNESQLQGQFCFTMIDPAELADRKKETILSYKSDFMHDVLITPDNTYEFEILSEERIKVVCFIVADYNKNELSEIDYLVVDIYNLTKKVKCCSIPFRFIRGFSKKEIDRIKYLSL